MITNNASYETTMHYDSCLIRGKFAQQATMREINTLTLIIALPMHQILLEHYRFLKQMQQYYH